MTLFLMMVKWSQVTCGYLPMNSTISALPVQPSTSQHLGYCQLQNTRHEHSTATLTDRQTGGSTWECGCNGEVQVGDCMNND